MSCGVRPRVYAHEQPTTFFKRAAVEDKVGIIQSTAEDALMTLKHECKRLLVLLPAKVGVPLQLPYLALVQHTVA